jgi:RimJ/RimL family protein N-acetyltransferase
VKNPFLIGTKIYLRPLEREDAGTLVPWFNDPEVTRYLKRYRPMNRRGEEEFIDKLSTDESAIPLGIVVRETDALIGAGGLHHLDFKNRSAAFGISIGEKSEWGQGYGGEATGLIVRYAFETLNLNRVWLLVYEFNERGRRTYEKVGFQKEGVLRQDYYRDGRYWDTLTMAILRQDWDALHPPGRDP